jgi:hypothetical protein
MEPDQARKRFAADGYVIVPNVFTRDQVTELRRELLAIFDKPPVFPGDLPLRPNGAALRVELAARYPALRWLLVHPPLLQSVRAILGDDFIYLPEMSAHDSGYGGWHKDTTSQETAGHRFQWEPSFAMLEVAIYLQDNHRLYAGGLDVIPGSHRSPDLYVQRDKTLAQRVRGRVDLVRKRRSLRTRPGDLLLFDFRIDHRATQPVPLVKIPTSHRKLAVFFACSANNEHARRYRDFIASREDYVYLHGDHQYPQDLVEMTKGAGVQLMT